LKSNLSDEVKLGTLGEIYYQALFGGLLSEDTFDEEKDLTQSDGKTVEIKTQSRYRHSNAFTVSKRSANLKKCLYVDRLIFIEYSLSDTINIWECVDRRSVFTASMEDVNGIRIMACWPVDKMLLLKKTKHPKLAEMMREFSKSKTLGWYE
jgi:hypothetical protein